MGSKSVRQCTEFYFLWKKVCVDEWRRMRVFRRRRIQDYQLRSTTDRDDLKPDEDPASVADTQVDEITNVSRRLSQLKYREFTVALVVPQ